VAKDAKDTKTSSKTEWFISGPDTAYRKYSFAVLLGGVTVATKNNHIGDKSRGEARRSSSLEFRVRAMALFLTDPIRKPIEDIDEKMRSYRRRMRATTSRGTKVATAIVFRITRVHMSVCRNYYRTVYSNGMRKLVYKLCIVCNSIEAIRAVPSKN